MINRPVKVAVISDAHVDCIGDLPPGLAERLSGADAIIHLGDYTTPEFLNSLRQLGHFYGIIGNHDSQIGRKQLNVIEVIEMAGKRLGLIHGLFLPMARPKRMRAWLKKYDIDVLLFGHNHLITQKTVGGVYLFNPGTVTGQFPATQATFGMLTLNGTIKGEIIPLDYSIPYRRNKLLRALAFLIRLGIRWLEAWPYIDPRPAVRSTKQHLLRLGVQIQSLVSRHPAA